MTDTRQVVTGEIGQRQGFFGTGEVLELRPGTYFLATFANMSALQTADGLLLVDTSVAQFADGNRRALRKHTQAPLHTIVYTHGHVDHAFGVQPWLDEGNAPRIVGHSNVVRRFHTYARMGGLNEHVNSVQFGIEGVAWPKTFFWPDVVYETALTLRIGGERFELRHGMGETDDATWVWAPERGVLCTGDFWISCAPNCGNPQKVQRYPEEWADALDEMAALDAELLLPGHGPPIDGAENVKTALLDASEYLRSIVEQTKDLLNEGLPPEEVVARVRVPGHLADKPYLQPVYDRPEFIVRNLIRRLGGWWDGFPADLLPADPRARAREIANLAGGADKLVERARQLADADIALACHLAEWASIAEPANSRAHECVRDLFHRRAEGEVSLMGRGIFMHAVRTAERALGS
jgi:alkyl sulfatase BDS1-like metallo-beta-lactamase superfamily hydrolase